MKSTEKLLIELAKLPNSIMKEVIIMKARQDQYHDFKSPDATPIINLVRDLKKFYEHTKSNIALQLIKKAQNGEFDATAEESKEWEESPEGKETLKGSRFKI